MSIYKFKNFIWLDNDHFPASRYGIRTQILCHRSNFRTLNSQTLSGVKNFLQKVEAAFDSFFGFYRDSVRIQFPSQLERFLVRLKPAGQSAGPDAKSRHCNKTLIPSFKSRWRSKSRNEEKCRRDGRVQRPYNCPPCPPTPPLAPAPSKMLTIFPSE